MKQIVIPRKLVFQCLAVTSIAQGIIVAKLLMEYEKMISQGKYLADIVSKNSEHLDEFDLIALRDLGLLKTPVND
jgi:hypothetical protein